MGRSALRDEADPMTDDTPPQTPDETPAGGDETPAGGDAPRRLTRSGSDGIIGGVASGLGRYFNVDPILFRIGFVIATFIGAAGLIAYVALVAFVPSDGEEKPGGTSKALAVAGAVVLGCLLVTFLSPPLFIFGPGLLVLGLIGLAGVLLWRALGGSVNGDPARTVGKIALAALIGAGVAGAALGVGLAAALGGGVVIASLAVVAGFALIATAFVGGARWLIVPALALVLPLGIVSAAGIDLDGGVGDRNYHPVSTSQVRDHYELGIGSLVVDMTDVDFPADHTTAVDVEVGLGEAVVYVPDDACISTDVQIGAGASDVLDRGNDGVDVNYVEDAPAPTGRPKLHINADVGVGTVEVVREGFVRDQFGGKPFWREDNNVRLGVNDEGGTLCA
jgi:phage shock protein PspC (stress-responsive transcriptional regulator)